MSQYTSDAYANIVMGIHEKYLQHRDYYIVRSFVWYIVLPLAVYIVFAPGLIFSLPAEKDCDSGVKTPISPNRVTVSNTLVAVFLFYLPLTLFIFWLGSKFHIDFPFQTADMLQFASLAKK